MGLSGGKSASFGTSDNRDYPKCRNVTILARFGGRAARDQWHQWNYEF
jgi:hypothetical protein